MASAYSHRLSFFNLTESMPEINRLMGNKAHLGQTFSVKTGT